MKFFKNKITVPTFVLFFVVIILMLFFIFVGPKLNWNCVFSGNNFATAYIPPVSPDGLIVTKEPGSAFTPATTTHNFAFKIYSYKDTQYGRVYSSSYSSGDVTGYGGTITNISTTTVFGGGGYNVGDILNILGGNNDATVQVLSTSTGDGHIIYYNVASSSGWIVDHNFNFKSPLENSGGLGASFIVDGVNKLWGSISSVIISDPAYAGYDYKIGDEITVTGCPSGGGGKIVVDSIFTGIIRNLIVYEPGINYQVGDQLSLPQASSSNNATATVFSIDGGGGITGVSVLNGGTGYCGIYTPNCQINNEQKIINTTGGSGSGAKLLADQTDGTPGGIISSHPSATTTGSGYVGCQFCPFGNNIQATVCANTGGTITSSHMTSAGTGFNVGTYTSWNTSYGNNTPVTINVSSVDAIGKESTVQLLNGGTGYQTGTYSLNGGNNPATIEVNSVNVDNSPYEIKLNWNTVSEADGYVVVVAEDSVNGYNNNYSFDIKNNSFIYNGTSASGTIGLINGNWWNTAGTLINNNAVIDNGTTTLTENEYVNDLVIATGGTLDLAGHTLSVGGNWTNSGGQLVSNGGTVNFVGINQSITGQNTFENLTKNSTVTSSLYFDSTATTTITNYLNLTGLVGNLLTISSLNIDRGSIVAHYLMNDATSSTIVDSINGYDGVTLSGLNTGNYYADHYPITGKINSAFYSNAYGGTWIPYNSNFNLSNTDFTITTWVKPAGVSSILDQYGGWKFNIAANRILEFGSYPYVSVNLPNSFQNNQWNFISVSYTNGEYTFQVNDSVFDPISGSAPTNTNNNINIANVIGVDDLRFFRDVLTQDSIDFIYNNGNGTELELPNSSFNIKLSDSGTASLSYLNVFNSNNISTNPLVCNTGCINGGGNTNWTLPSQSRARKNIFISQSTAPIITAPPNINDTSTDLIISPSQSGNYSKDTTLGKVILEIPAHAVTSTTTFSVTEESSTSTSANISILNKELISSGTYNISAIDTDGNAVHTFASPITITIPIPSNITDTSDLGVYYFGEATNTWTLIPDATFTNNQAVFSVSHLTRFAIFSTVGTTSIENSTKTQEQTPQKEIIPAKAKRQQIVSTDESSSSENISTEISSSTPIQNTTSKNISLAVTSKVQVTSSSTSSSTGTIAQNNIPNNFGESVKQTYMQTAVAVEKSIKATKDIVGSPIGGAVTKVVSTAGIVAGASVSVSAVAFATPLSLAEIWLIPARIFGLFAGAISTKRKNRQWGTVYDSITKRPLDPVYVTLINTETDKEVASAITDIDGRYGFLVLPGKYRIIANKTNYIAPSIIMKGKTFDEVYNDLYFGDEIVITKEGEIITKNIPMDSMSFDWNEFAKTKMNVNTFMKSKDIKSAKLSKLLFVMGAAVSLISIIFVVSPYNIIVAGLYILAYVFNYFVLNIKKSGLLTEKNTGAPLSFAIIKIFREDEITPIAKKIADKFGAYYVLVPRDKYYIKIEKKNDDGTYTEIFTSDTIDAKYGVINMDFSL